MKMQVYSGEGVCRPLAVGAGAYICVIGKCCPRITSRYCKEEVFCNGAVGNPPLQLWQYIYPCDVDGSPRGVLVHVCGSIGYLGVKGQKKEENFFCPSWCFLVADYKTGMLSSGVGPF